MSTSSRWQSRTGNSLSAVIKTITWIVVAFLALGILLTWTDANRGNELVDFIFDVGEWLATPLNDVFTPDSPEASIYQNWTLAAVVYWAVGMFLAWLVRSSFRL